MDKRQFGWAVFLAGLPFAPFLNRQLDLWHAQALWAQVWIGLLFAWTIADGVRVQVPKPLSAWIVWTVCWFAWVWTKSITGTNQYPLPLLMPILHLVILWIAWVAMSGWTPAILTRLLNVVAWSGIVVLAYSLLQWANLDQFFTNNESVSKRAVVVGTIGNASHLAAYMALLLPIYAWKRWWFVFGISVILLWKLGSAGGWLAAWGAWGWWTWHQHRRVFWISLGLFGVGVGWWLFHPSLFDPSGRLKAWAIFWSIFQKQPITGYGLGFISQFSRQVTEGPIFAWRHVHNEPFQLAIEQGLIGVAILGWFLWDMGTRIWRADKTPLIVTLAGIAMAFILNSFVNFPAHLWMTGSLALLAFGGLSALTDARD